MGERRGVLRRAKYFFGRDIIAAPQDDGRIFGDDEVEWEHEAGGSDENQTVASAALSRPTLPTMRPSVEWGIRGLLETKGMKIKTVASAALSRPTLRTMRPSVEWGIRGLGWLRKKTKTGRAICYPPVPFALPFGALFPEHSCVTPTYGDAFERRPISCGICAGIVKGGKRGQIQKVPQEQKQILPLRCTQGQEDNRG